MFALSFNVKQVLFDPEIGLFRLDLTWERWQWKEYSEFPKAPALLEPQHQIV